MNRTHSIIGDKTHNKDEVFRKMAIHEAGHAASIMFVNQQKGLSPLPFQISICAFIHDSQSFGSLDIDRGIYFGKVENGRNIHILPSSIAEALKGMSVTQSIEYERAFDADIINLFAGPVAEAKYVAQRDGEPFSPYLVNMESLENYGGKSDMEILNRYSECISLDIEIRKRKIHNLYLAAFSVINNRSIWFSITTLAEHILRVGKNTIEFDEIKTVLKEADNYRE